MKLGNHSVTAPSKMVEETQTPSVLMEKTGKIIRSCVHNFLKHFQFFNKTPVTLLIPFSASVFLSQSLFQQYSYSLFESKLESSHLYQNIFGYVLSLPLSLSSLIAAKSCVVQTMNHHHHQPPNVSQSFMSLYGSLLMTYFCNLTLIITINFTAFTVILFIPNNHPLCRLTSGFFSYVSFTNTMLICNLSLAVSGTENCKGFKAIYKVCSLKRGRKSIALLLALPFNLGLAAIESLFRFRITRAYQNNLGRIGLSMVLEGLLICYMYSVVIVLDTIAAFLFIRSWESNSEAEQAADVEVEIVDQEGSIRIVTANTKILEEIL